jgi:hypothetical protein
MEWLSWVSPLVALGGLIVTASIGYYRIGQNEKKIDQNKADQDKRCEQCQVARKEQKAMEETRATQGQAQLTELMKMHSAQVAANATEHSLINISAARTEEQLKNVLANSWSGSGSMISSKRRLMLDQTARSSASSPSLLRISSTLLSTYLV